MFVTDEDLHRLVHNARLMSQPKKSLLDGATKWWSEGDRLHALASDDFIAIHDSVPWYDPEGLESPYIPGQRDPLWSLALPYEDLRALDTVLRNPSERPVEALTLLYEGSSDLTPTPTQEKHFDFIQAVIDLDFESQAPDRFAFWPDRIYKIQRLKPGKFPLDMRYSDNLFQFKLGPDLRGAMADLERDELESEWLW